METFVSDAILFLQKSDAMNGILERLRAEAKTVAATLDRLRENAGAENMTRAERV